MFICYNNSNSCNGHTVSHLLGDSFVGIIPTGVSDKYYQYTVSGKLPLVTLSVRF